MKVSYFILLTIITLYSCKTENQSSPADIQEEAGFDSLAIRNEIYTCMDAQQQSWNNADITGFMSCYWNSDSLRFIGKSGLNLGWQKTLDNYKKSYPDSAAMGKLQFDNLEFLPLNSKQAFVIGKWTLFRVTDTLSGHYTLLWEKKANAWKIIADHSS